MTNLLRQSLTVAFLGAVLFALNLFAFTEPIQSPPGGNVSAPINVSGTTQDKTGWLTFQGGGTRSSTYLATQGGNVGIGTTDPQYKLDVQGDARWTGTLQGGTVPWGRLTGVPSGLNDGDQVGITSESDPTVQNWAKTSSPNIPGDISAENNSWGSQTSIVGERCPNGYYVIGVHYVIKGTEPTIYGIDVDCAKL